MFTYSVPKLGTVNPLIPGQTHLLKYWILLNCLCSFLINRLGKIYFSSWISCCVWSIALFSLPYIPGRRGASQRDNIFTNHFIMFSWYSSFCFITRHIFFITCRRANFCLRLVPLRQSPPPLPHEKKWLVPYIHTCVKKVISVTHFFKPRNRYLLDLSLRNRFNIYHQ